MEPGGLESFRLPWTARAMRRLLLAVVAALVLLNVAARYLAPRSPIGIGELALNKFLLDSEQCVPAWFSSVLLLGAAVLIGIMSARVHRAGGRFHGHWRLLSAIFLLLSIDEASSFHELLIVPLRERLALSGVFYYAWVVPAAMICAALAAAYLPMVLSLGATFRNRLFLAGLCFVGGAVGMEMAGGAAASDRHMGTGYFIITTIEETLEMLGLVVLIHALIEELRLGGAGSDAQPPLSRPSDTPAAEPAPAAATD